MLCSALKDTGSLIGWSSALCPCWAQENLTKGGSAPTRVLPEHQSHWKLKCYYPRSKWKVPHYRKVESLTEPRHLRFIQAVHHSQNFCGKSNITLADGEAEGKKSFLTSKTTAVWVFKNFLCHSLAIEILCPSSIHPPLVMGHWLTPPVTRKWHLERQHSLDEKMSLTFPQVGHRTTSFKQDESWEYLNPKHIHTFLCIDQ